MELRHLRYFVVLASELHFGRAANKLHISQPPLSIQIKDLEKEIGTRLFNRTKRSVTLTKAGNAFLMEAKEILERVTRAKTAALQAARGETGSLAIAFISVADYNLLPFLIREFQKKHPLVALHLNEATSDVQISGLKSGSIDLGFLLPSAKVDGITSSLITEEKLVAVLPKSHPASKKPGPISIKSLSHSPFVMTPRKNAPGLHDNIIRFCEKYDFQPQISQEAIQMQTVVSLVAAEMGVSLIPESIQNLRRPGVVYKEVKEKTPKIEIHMAWKQSNELPTLNKFREFTREAISRYGSN